MKIALYQASARPGQDGTTTTLGQMLAAMDRERIRYRVFTPDPPADGAAGAGGDFVRVPSLRLPFYRDYGLALPRRRDYWGALDDFAPDLVHIGTPDAAGLSMLKWSRRNDVPAIGAYHTHFPAYLQHYRLAFMFRALWRYLRWFYGACAATLVPTPVIAAELAARGIQRLCDWPRGVDPARFAPRYRSPELRRSWGVGPGDCVFAYVGRLANEKNVPLLAAAWAAVRARQPRARLVWVGDGPWRARLERLTPDATFTGRLRGEALAAAYASADALVFPSQTDTFGNVVLEAQASGLPVIGLDGTAVTACVRHRESGLLLPRAEPACLADAMEALAGNADERRRMGDQALRQARGRTWQAVFDGQFAVYRDVLAAAGRRKLGRVETGEQGQRRALSAG
jgi:glycosyltransferase involved in cell wall biosynthesis